MIRTLTLLSLATLLGGCPLVGEVVVNGSNDEVVEETDTVDTDTTETEETDLVDTDTEDTDIAGTGTDTGTGTETEETDDSVDSEETDVVDTDETVETDTEETDLVDTEPADTDIAEETDMVDTDIACIDCDSDGVTAPLDCDDHDAAVSPLERETCNGVDDDCDGMVDDGVKTRSWLDRDLDGFGDAAQLSLACTVPSGYVRNNDDCDDRDAYAFPGATEVPNGRDDNCDGSIDEGFGDDTAVDTDETDTEETDAVDTEPAETDDTIVIDTAIDDTADTGGDTGDTAVETDTEDTTPGDTDVVDTEPVDTDDTTPDETDTEEETDETDVGDTDTVDTDDSEEDTAVEPFDYWVASANLACEGEDHAEDACIVDVDGDGHNETLLMSSSSWPSDVRTEPSVAYWYENRPGCWSGTQPNPADVAGVNNVGYYIIRFDTLEACSTEMTLWDTIGGNNWWRNYEFCTTGDALADDLCVVTATHPGYNDYLLALSWDGVDLEADGVGR